MAFGFAGSQREPVQGARLEWGDVDTNDFGALAFDVVVSELHNLDADVTEHPVEQGANVADHVRPKNASVTIEVFVSNVPIFSSDSKRGPLVLNLPTMPGPPPPLDRQTGTPGSGTFLAGGTSAILDTVANALKAPPPAGYQQAAKGKTLPATVTANVYQFGADIDYVKNTKTTLERLRTTATLLRVITPRSGEYDNMVLKRIEHRRDKGAGTGGYFTLDLQQIRVVTSQIVDAPQPSIVRATPSVDNGKKDGTLDNNGVRTSLLNKQLNKTGQIAPPAFGIASGLPGGA